MRPLTILVLAASLTACAIGYVRTADGPMAALVVGNAKVETCPPAPIADVGPMQPQCTTVAGGSVSGQFVTLVDLVVAGAVAVAAYFFA